MRTGKPCPPLARARCGISSSRNIPVDEFPFIASRTALAAQLAGLGFQVLPSAANFLFVRHPQHDAAQLAAALRADGIIVRHFKSERISQFLRITIGTDEDCGVLVEALRRHLGQQS